MQSRESESRFHYLCLQVVKQFTDLQVVNHFKDPNLPDSHNHVHCHCHLGAVHCQAWLPTAIFYSHARDDLMDSKPCQGQGSSVGLKAIPDA